MPSQRKLLLAAWALHAVMTLIYAIVAATTCARLTSVYNVRAFDATDRRRVSRCHAPSSRAVQGAVSGSGVRTLLRNVISILSGRRVAKGEKAPTWTKTGRRPNLRTPLRAAASRSRSEALPCSLQAQPCFYFCPPLNCACVSPLCAASSWYTSCAGRRSLSSSASRYRGEALAQRQVIQLSLSRLLPLTLRHRRLSSGLLHRSYVWKLRGSVLCGLGYAGRLHDHQGGDERK